MMLLILVALALAVVAGFWYSYYQSVQKLRAHDRETARMMEQQLEALLSAGAPAERVSDARAKLDAFRAKHNVR